MAKLTAIVTTFNREDFIAVCIRSIFAAASERLQVRVIVMDNGSADDTPAVLRAAEAEVPEHGQLEVHRTEDNRPIVGVLNRGLALAREEGCDYIVAMNDDTEYTPGSLQRLVDACDAHPESVLTPLQINYREQDRVDSNVLGHLREVDALIEDAALGRALQAVYDLPTIIGACMFARRDVWDNIGCFDELFWFYGVDDDLCTRARYLGYRTLLVPASHLFHAHGKLDAPAQSPTQEGIRRKWRFETQARFVFAAKNPEVRPLRAWWNLTTLALKTSATCLIYGWPWGAWQALVIYAWFVPRYPEFAQTRQQHFGPARRR